MLQQGPIATYDVAIQPLMRSHVVVQMAMRRRGGTTSYVVQ